ncbi:MAG: ABC transporter substrate-binding protein [bacterium]
MNRKLSYRTAMVAALTLVLVTAGMPSPAYSAGGSILIYSPWKDGVMKKFTTLFEEKTGIKAESINISSGEIAARLRVEKARPQADVWHSVRASYLVPAQEQGIIAPYNPPNAKYVLKPYTYPGEDYIMGTTMYPLVFAYNSKLIKEMGVDPPKSYTDLLDPKWKGQIVMPHPAASGTAYAFVGLILQMNRAEGETGINSKAGWAYLKKLMVNVAQYTRSGSAPSKMVARGEFPIGITFYDRVYRLQEEGYPIVPVFPMPIYADPSNTAIVANSPNPEGAKAFLNFMLSKEAQELAKETGNYSVRPDVARPKGAIAISEMKIFDSDYMWAAKNKKAIIGQFNIYEWKSKKK